MYTPVITHQGHNDKGKKRYTSKKLRQRNALNDGIFSRLFVRFMLVASQR